MALHLPGPNPDLTYTEALHRLLSLADLERMAGIEAPAVKYDLHRVRVLCDRMDLLDNPTPVFHVAGTKGKGSVCAMISSALRAQGLVVGLYTSPHLHSFRERIRLNGEPLSKRRFADAVARLWPYVCAMAAEAEGPPTTFEALTAMALDTFLQEQVGAVVLEVGLGGRLDATNIVGSDVAVITSISYDHTSILGETLREIAGEKAGIIKSAAPVVSAPQAPEAMSVIEQTCSLVGAPLAVAGRDVEATLLAHGLSGQQVRVASTSRRYDVTLPLLGSHQAENAAVAIGALEAGPIEVTRESVERGLASVNWDGRFQVLSYSPYLVVDGAHNAYSIARLGDTVREYFPAAHVHVVFGASADKHVDDMADELTTFADAITTVSSRHPRALSPAVLAALLQSREVPAVPGRSVEAAVRAALAAGGTEDLVLVTGSLFVVAEAIEAWTGISGELYPEFDPQATALGRAER